jgi:excisionase family DNA binding protein
MTQNSGELLSVQEAAERLKISIHTLRAWISQRRIGFIKLGRRVLFRSEDLEAFIDAHVVQPKSYKAIG